MTSALAIPRHFAFYLTIVLLTACRREPSPVSGGSTASTPSAFTVRALTAERSSDHVHLTATVHVRNPGTVPLILTPPAAQLWIGPDKPAPPFIAPLLEPVSIAGGVEAEAALHWWVATADLSGSLELEIAGARQLVKAATPFAIDSLPENKTMALSFPRWKLIH